jgi:hypothetical protein
MASSQANMDKMQLRQSYRNLWHTDLTNAIQADFPCEYNRRYLRPLSSIPSAGCRLLIDFSCAVVVVPCRLLPVALVVSDPWPGGIMLTPPFSGVSAPRFSIDLRRFGRVFCGYGWGLTGFRVWELWLILHCVACVVGGCAIIYTQHL